MIEYPKQYSITIDLVPYTVDVYKRGLMVRDCRGSVLGNLDKVTNFTIGHLTPRTNFYMAFEGDDLRVQQEQPFMYTDIYTRFVEWVRDNFESIEHIENKQYSYEA